MFHPLAGHRYGPSRVRLVKISRRGDRHDLKDIAVDVSFSGDYEPSYVVGDNSMVLPADTMKNTIYAFARSHQLDEIESFGLALSEHFINTHGAVSRVQVKIGEHLWKRISVGEKPQGQAFLQPGLEIRTTAVTRTSESLSVESGFEGLPVLKSARSQFSGFLRDRFTTLEEAKEPILTTMLGASWEYGGVAQPFGAIWHGVRQLILETFAQHESLSTQHTLYAIADVVLENYREIAEIRFSLAGRRCIPVDLSPFGLDNPNEIFVPADDASELVEATVRRRSDEGVES